MSVKINPNSIIEARIGIANKGPMHAFFTETCYKHMTKFIPGGVKSHLNQNVDIDIDKITYKSSDAHYLYNGLLYVDPKYNVGAFPIRGGKISFKESDGMIEDFVSRKGIAKIPTNKKLNYNTPGTGDHWDKRMVSAEIKDIIKEVQNYNGGR